jgi:tripeptide aminopeptidase
MDLLLHTFLDLVQIPSPSRCEGRVAVYVRDFLAARGVAVREDAAAAGVGGECGNLVAVLPARAVDTSASPRRTRTPRAASAGAETPRSAHRDAQDAERAAASSVQASRGDARDPAFLFLAHMDTVTPAEPVRIVRENGVIRTDGAAVLGADAKSGVAVMLALIDELVREPRAHPELRFLFTVNEESGPSGAEFLDDDALRDAVGFVLDSSGDTGTLVSETPTARFFEIAFTGRAAHAGLAPEKGVNAIALAARAIAEIPQGRVDANTLVNIGRIEGGERRNVVPPRVACEGEVRCFAPARCEDVLARIRAICETHASRMGGEARLTDRAAFTGYRLAESDEPVPRVVAAMRTLGVGARLLRHGGGSDANELVRRGVPAVNIGMGYTGNHSTSEQMPEAKLRWVLDLARAIVEG